MVQFLPQHTNGSLPQHMRLLTYNIHYWAGLDGRLNLDHLVEVMRRSQADVIGLNEVLHPLYTPRGPRFPLVELADALGMYWAFGPSFEQQQGGRFWPGLLGNAVLSRYPIRHTRNVTLPLVPTRKQRTLFHVCLEVNGHSLTVFVTHLDHLLAPVRRVQFEAICQQLSRTREPHVLMGDFNTHTPVRSRWWRGEVLVRRLRTLGYVDAFARVGEGRGHSYPTVFPLARIDYVWVPEDWAWALQAARVLDTPATRVASDHLPLWVYWHWEAVVNPTSGLPHGRERGRVRGALEAHEGQVDMTCDRHQAQAGRNS